MRTAFYMRVSGKSRRCPALGGYQRLAGKMQYLDFGTIFFMVVAVVIIFQLRSVLGKRTGNERPPFDPYTDRSAARDAKPEDNVVSLPKRKRGEEAGDERDGERQRLAAAGAAAAEHVAAGERVGEGGGLDGERRGDAVGGERGLEGRGHAEGRERARRGHGGHGGSLCVGVAVLAKGHAGTGNRCTRPLGGSATTPNTLPGIWG